MSNRFFVGLFLLCMGLAVFGGSNEAMAQCAMCRKALESPEAQETAAAFRRAILLLLPVPFGLAGAIGYRIVRARRRFRLEHEPPLRS